MNQNHNSFFGQNLFLFKCSIILRILENSFNESKPKHAYYASISKSKRVEYIFRVSVFVLDADLNRNFPDNFTPTRSAVQPETQAIKNWMSSTQFVLSAALHGGALVTNLLSSHLSASILKFNFYVLNPPLYSTIYMLRIEIFKICLLPQKYISLYEN